MTTSQAHDLIRRTYGRGSRQDQTACYLLARGRFAEVLAMATTLTVAAQAA